MCMEAVRRRATSLVLVALLATACGTAGGKDMVIVSSHPHGATAVANQKASEREAEHLLDEALVPSGATRVDSGVKGLDGPALGTPVVDTLVDAVRYWHVSRSPDATYMWLQQHAPAGLTKEGSSSGGGNGVVAVQGLSYWAGRTAAYQSAELEIGVAEDGKGESVVRVDGVVVWLDPKPLPDSGAVDRIHFGVRDGCPATDGQHYGLDGVNNSGNDLRTRLLPAASPSAALLCHYGPALNTKQPFALTRHVLMNAHDAAGLAAAANNLPLSHTNGGVSSGCGGYDPGTALIALSYPGRQDVDLSMGLGSCAGVGNGFIRTSSGELAVLVLRLVS